MPWRKQSCWQFITNCLWSTIATELCGQHNAKHNNTCKGQLPLASSDVLQEPIPCLAKESTSPCIADGLSAVNTESKQDVDYETATSQSVAESDADESECQRFDSYLPISSPVRSVLCKDCKRDFYMLNPRHTDRRIPLEVNVWKCRQCNENFYKRHSEPPPSWVICRRCTCYHTSLNSCTLIRSSVQITDDAILFKDVG